MGAISLVFLFLLSTKWCDCNSSKLLEINHPKAELQRLLNDILIRNLLPYKCVTVITDSVYSSFFNRKWFHSFQAFISFVTIIIDDTEDMMSPYNGTQKALAMSIEASCQMYIILLSNGIQCSRLLRFGDRYAISTVDCKCVPEQYLN
ncbi:hypothetical protein WA026_022152 [Henosepilachna vigintioctopunctata]|uniref:Uncharacterized protein n=1 Tax=Henosepilachna vigintioctopunctata TaxID=420089 RepID=A0AAW1TZ02_9CUCU